MNNADIANVFLGLADLLERKRENRFKILAYRKAARAIEVCSEDLAHLVGEGREKELRDIPGVGEAIAKKIVELVGTGKLSLYERLKAEFPDGK